ncbi:hypothetical protein [Stenotrophomonas sp.]|uniref:hypothetical protein n=1 Tax=Stenotrophomonas sp. TaxID=69392 RepID=UPI003D6C8FDB
MDDDHSYYARLAETRGGSEYSVFPAYLAWARQSKSYLKGAQDAANLPCRRWIAFQSIEANSSRATLSFFCESNRGWEEDRVGSMPVDVPQRKGRTSVAKLSEIIARAQVVEGEFVRPGVSGLPAKYLTSFDGMRVRRLAVYWPAGREMEDGQPSAAMRLIRDVEGVVSHEDSK